MHLYLFFISKILQLENILNDKQYIEVIKQNLPDKDYSIKFEYLLMSLCELNGNLDKLLVNLQAPSLKPLIQRLKSSLESWKANENNSKSKKFSDCYNRIIYRMQSLDPKNYRVCYFE